ncbi:ChbG/HpnK family deacetylase [Butyrivibrio fibrisolvens]|uniref:ChbG/HpnK family deacetylase n=1 Tax=Butyrivibrio fibrisolvens TaxID=831 RepID=UPI0003FF9671|nr:ChbG/HpnK family deacetylase [Butyrivibrio fibrisolvens]
MIEFHADDYAMFPGESRRILDCYHEGVLNGVSVLTNSPHLEECMEILVQEAPDMRLTVHINFYEGKALTPAKEIPLLVKNNGVFDISFGRLCIVSYMLPHIRNKYRAQLAKEIKAQILALRPWCRESFRLDGHGHYHMIPVVFDAMCDVIKEEHLNVTYVRVPREELSMYHIVRKELVDFRPINVLKVLILNLFIRRNKRRYPRFFNKLKKHLFAGVYFPMRYENALPLLKEGAKIIKERSEKDGVEWDYEMLFHPGDVREPKDLEEITIGKDKGFFISEDRKRDYDALHQLKDVVKS